MDNFSRFLNYLAAVILVGVAVLLFFFVWNNIGDVSVEKESISLKVYQDHPTDKGVKYYKIQKEDLEKLEKLLTRLDDSAKKLEDSKEGVLESLKEKEYKNVYSSLIAIILAVAGFFGFKSMHEIKSQSIQKAEEAAREVAKKVSTDTAKDVADNYLSGPFFDKALQAAFNATNRDLSEIKGDLVSLNDALDECTHITKYFPHISTKRGETSQDKAPQDEAPQDEAPQDEAPQDEAPQDEAPQDEAPQDKAPQDKAPQDKAPQDKAPQDKAPQDKAPRRRTNPFTDDEGSA